MTPTTTTTPTTTAARAGLRRGAIELRQSLTSPADLWNHCFWPALTLIGAYFLRHVAFQHSGFQLGTLALPSILGMNASMAMIVMSQHLTADREDGTLLRAKAIPNGIIGYLTGKIVLVSGSTVIDLALFLVPGVLLIPGLAIGSAQAWLTVLWVLALGLVATLPLGAVLGSLFSSARSQGLLTLPIMGLIAISGIFYPLRALPHWLQILAQCFPVYWMGLGMRSALLPPAAVAVEVGQSWRHLETVAALGAWAVVGMLFAPAVLRRMARRESGSALLRRRDVALQRIR